METYLPYPSISESIAVMRACERIAARDSAVTVLGIRHQSSELNFDDYRDHPVVQMWVNHEVFLCHYALEMNKSVGNEPLLEEAIEYHLASASSGEYTMAPPFWFGDADFHESHQSMLLRIEPTYYKTIFHNVSNRVPTRWPRKA